MTQNINTTMRQKKEKALQFLLGCTFRVCLFVFVLVMGVLYVGHMSSASTKGYTLSQLQGEIENLENENQKLQYDISQYRSMESILNRLEGKEFVSLDQPVYVSLTGNKVAVRD